MQDLKDVIERMEPAPEAQGDWDAVLRDANRPRRPSFMRPLAAVAAAASVLFALALFQPWESESPTLLERALAVVDDGPVLRAVLRGEWGGTLIDLQARTREPVYGEREVWYDSERKLVRMITRLGGVVEYDHAYKARRSPDQLGALGQRYREALEAGTARVAGEDTLDGERVVWITVRSEQLRDVSDGKEHEWAEEVAVSRKTFAPVALRQTRDGEPGPGTLERVLELETLPAGEGDFTPSPDSPEGKVFIEGREPIALERAEEALGRTPLWLGREHEDLLLSATFRTTLKMGRQARIELTGAEARQAEKCSRLEGEEHGRCLRALGRESLEVGPSGVFTRGPTVWEEEHTGLQLFYGMVGDDPSTYRKEDDVPLVDRPHVTITEATHRSPFRRGVSRYVPPEGSLYILAGGHMGTLDVEGVYVSIEAPSEQLMLSAANALEPMTP